VSETRVQILDTAYDLFSHRGIRAVGLDELIERASQGRRGPPLNVPWNCFTSLDPLSYLPRLEVRNARSTSSQMRGSNPCTRLFLY
jgi:hypothetical protein